MNFSTSDFKKYFSLNPWQLKLKKFESHKGIIKKYVCGLKLPIIRAQTAYLKKDFYNMM